MDPKNEIDINADFGSGFISGLISGTGSVLQEVNKIYGSFCSSLPNKNKKDGTFVSGKPYRLPSKLSNRLKSDTCIDEQSTKDVVRATRFKLVGKYLRAGAGQFDKFKKVEIELYWEYTNCVSTCHIMYHC